jgi:hypothetical protein
MIPYDDLVAALAAWRERQGMPIAGTTAATAAPSAPAVKAPSGPGASSGPRSAPPPPQAARPAAPPPAPAPAARATPPPLAAVEVDDDALLDEAHYDNEGSDFAMAFGQEEGEGEGEATAIGVPPMQSGGRTDPAANPTGTPRGGKRNNDW